MVVQHFSPVGFSRSNWPAEAQRIMSNLNLSYKKFSELEYPNPPIELGEVYIGYKRGKNQLKLIYILPKPIWDGKDEIWATFVRIYPPSQAPSWMDTANSEWRVGAGRPTKMSMLGFDPTISRMTKKIEISYPEYISLTELEKLLRPIKFINWMKERPLSQNKETEIIKEKPPPKAEEPPINYDPLSSLFDE